MLMLTHINADGTYSIIDSDIMDCPVRHFKLEEINRPVLGIFRDESMNVVEMHPVQAKDVVAPLYKKEVFEPIVSEDLRYFAMNIIRVFPKYFFEVAASSTGKYHPHCDLGEQGLVRHVRGVCRIMGYISRIESTRMQFNQRALDCMYIACLCHDFLKSGWDKDYENNKYTRWEHPLLAANAIRNMRGLIDQQSLELIAHCIETHMGQYNVDTHGHSNVVLPKPSDSMQWLVHLCDMLASRADINMTFENTIFTLPTVNVVNPINSEILQKAQYVDVKPKIEVTEKDKKIIKAALEVGVKKEIVDKYRIPYNQEKIIGVWSTLLKSSTCSENQEKYLLLAKVIATPNDTEAVKKLQSIKPIERKKLSDSDKMIISVAMQKSFDISLLEKVGIQGDKEKVLGVWNTMLQYGNYTEKQEKYIKLAKVIAA